MERMMHLNRVTVTGADDSTNIDAMFALARRFPFVEWGILLSASSRGKPRFPSLEWLRKLHDAYLKHQCMTLSFHVCGRWVREICAGNWSPLFVNTGRVLDLGQRVQLNFRSYTHLLTPAFFPNAIERCREQGWQVIFQCDGVNDHLVSNAYDDGLDAVPLYDKSGGAGVVPDAWPPVMRGIYSGYTGGLGPDNLAQQLDLIAQSCGDNRCWIDAETKLRSADNRTFDLAKVERFLGIAESTVREDRPSSGA